MPRMYRTLFVMILAAIVVLPALAGEGRTPLYQWSNLITSPGKYVVTQNIFPLACTSPTIDIQSDNVDVDLNGFMLLACPGHPVVHAVGHSNITIRNGTLTFADYGIQIDGGVDGTFKAVIEDVKVLNVEIRGIELRNVTDFALRRNNVYNATNDGILVDGTGAPFPVQGTIEDNQVEECGSGISLFRGSSVALLNNRIERTLTGNGITIESLTGGLISENTVQDTSWSGIYLGDSSGNKLYNNIVRTAGTDDAVGPAGIWLAGASDDNLILNNVVSQAFTDGVWIEGAGNHIDRNVMNNNGTGGTGHGLHLNPTARDNTFGRNTARRNPGGACGAPPGPPFNTTDFCDDNAGATNNTSFNDNYMPTWF